MTNALTIQYVKVSFYTLEKFILIEKIENRVKSNSSIFFERHPSSEYQMFRIIEERTISRMQSISVNCNFRQNDTWTKYGEKITSGRERSYCETYMYYWSEGSRLAQQCYSVPQISMYSDYINLTSEELILFMGTFAHDDEIVISVYDRSLLHLSPKFLNGFKHGYPSGLDYLNVMSKAKMLPETNLLNTNNQDVYCFGDKLGVFPDYEYRKV